MDTRAPKESTFAFAASLGIWRTAATRFPGPFSASASSPRALAPKERRRESEHHHKRLEKMEEELRVRVDSQAEEHVAEIEPLLRKHDEMRTAHEQEVDALKERHRKTFRDSRRRKSRSNDGRSPQK